MRRRQLLAAAAAAVTPACLGRSPRQGTTSPPTDTPTPTPTPTCPPPELLLVNGRREPIEPTVAYVTADGQVSLARPRVGAADDNGTTGHILRPTVAPDAVARVDVFDGARGRPDLLLGCETFPADEPLRLYFHPAGDVEVRNPADG